MSSSCLLLSRCAISLLSLLFHASALLPSFMFFYLSSFPSSSSLYLRHNLRQLCCDRLLTSVLLLPATFLLLLATAFLYLLYVLVTFVTIHLNMWSSMLLKWYFCAFCCSLFVFICCFCTAHSNKSSFLLYIFSLSFAPSSCLYVHKRVSCWRFILCYASRDLLLCQLSSNLSICYSSFHSFSSFSTLAYEHHLSSSLSSFLMYYLCFHICTTGLKSNCFFCSCKMPLVFYSSFLSLNSLTFFSSLYMYILLSYM